RGTARRLLDGTAATRASAAARRATAPRRRVDPLPGRDRAVRVGGAGGGAGRGLRRPRPRDGSPRAGGPSGVGPRGAASLDAPKDVVQERVDGRAPRRDLAERARLAKPAALRRARRGAIRRPRPALRPRRSWPA